MNFVGSNNLSLKYQRQRYREYEIWVCDKDYLNLNNLKF